MLIFATMSADGRYALPYPTGSQVLVWDTQQGTNIYTNSASSAAISPDGARLLYRYKSTNKLPGLGQRN